MRLISILVIFVICTIAAGAQVSAKQIVKKARSSIVERELRNLPTQIYNESDPRGTNFDFQTEVLGSRMVIFWTIHTAQVDQQVIDFAIDAETSGWVAVGISPNGRMLNSDAALFWIDSDEVLARDVFITQRSGQCSPPQGVCDDNVTGGSYDILDFTGIEQDGRTQIIFRRKLQTGDERDYNFLTNSTKQFLVFAFGTSDPNPNPASHTSGNRGSIQVTFQNGQSQDFVYYNPVLVAHASLMFLAWGVLAPFAAILARQLKCFNWWFKWHIALNSLALLFTVVSTLLAVTQVSASRSFTQAHHNAGLALAIISTVLQPILGYLANKYWDPARDSIPLWPDGFHITGGWVSLLLGLANIMLGLIQFQADLVLVKLYAFWLLMMGLFLIVPRELVSEKIQNTSLLDKLDFHSTDKQTEHVILEESSGDEAANLENI